MFVATGFKPVEKACFLGIMSSAKDNALNNAVKLMDVLKLNGIEVVEAYVFGSILQGATHESSDIDIAIVSKDFTGIP